ncbi:uncharacterized protein LOC144445873 [Glandiceps talaboti]
MAVNNSDHFVYRLVRPFRYLFLLLLLVRYSVHGIDGVDVMTESRCKVYNETYVDCSMRRLHHIPDNLPEFTTYLDVSFNQFSILRAKHLSRLHKLSELRVAYSYVTMLASDSLLGLFSLKVLILLNNQITTIDENAFRDLHNLQTLDLSANKLTDLPDGLFTTLSKLSVLDLGINNICHVSSPFLHGVYNLQELHMNSNHISTIADDAFIHLNRLTLVDLGSNRLKCIPAKALAVIRNIETLVLNTLDLQNDCPKTSFSEYPSLKRLSLFSAQITDSNIVLYDFSNTTLQELDLGANFLSAIPDSVIKNVSVGKLTLERNPLTSNRLEKLLINIQNVSITALSLSSLNGLMSPGFQIMSTTFKGLNGTLLQELDVSYNNMTSLPAAAFQWLPYLTTLDIEYCQLYSLHPQAFIGLSNLQSLSLTGNLLHNIQETLVVTTGLNSLHVLHLNKNKLTGRIPNHAFSHLNSLLGLYLNGNNIFAIQADSFTSLSKLKILDLSFNDIAYLPHNAFLPLALLDVLHLKGNPIQKTDDKETHPFNGLHNLRVLSLGIYSVLTLKRFHFEDVPLLQKFYIGGIRARTSIDESKIVNMPNLEILQIENTSIRGWNLFDILGLQQGKMLTTLELENNALEEIDMTDLNIFPNLRRVSFKNNKINKVKGIPKPMMYLENLDLSDNQITGLDVDMINSLPALKYLDLYPNPFDCSCKAQLLNKWIQNDHQVALPLGPNCFQPETKRGASIFSLHFGLECNILFMSLVPTSCILFLAIVTISLCVHFHWHLRYLIFLIKLKCGGYQPQVNDDEEAQPLLKYDAFVVYNQHDRPWVMQQLVPNLEKIDPPNFKLCIHERDFIGGNDIFDNILDSIENSHKTMLILSPHFAESEWCYFEMRMAQDHLFAERRDVLLLVLLENIPDDVMPRVLRKILRTKRYIEWPQNEIGRRLFWEKLKVEVRSGNRVNRPAEI